MNKPLKEFSTHDVDLAAFLMLQGLKFIECKIDETPGSKPRVLMRFFDEKEVARDLEKVFMSSEVKKFRDLHKYLLREIHRTLKGL
jgi:hypothetical protein